MPAVTGSWSLSLLILMAGLCWTVMSRLIARILQAVLLFPLAAIVQLVAYFMIDGWQRSSGSNYRYSSEMTMGISALAASGFVAIYWIMLWKHAVKWTSVRIWQSLAAVPAALVAGIGI